jgi:clan AA aspartic protease (TIGR02281 family)
VQENMPTLPLLGQTFFRDFQYTIDNAGKSILFVKNGSSAATVANEHNSVPFRNEGREVIVSADINGRSIPMYFDTGAEYCTFSFEHLKQLGISVPDDARQTISVGIAGNSKSFMFTVPRIRLGPIEKQDVPIMATGDHLPHPLLGQTFFGDLRYEFDNQDHLLMIRR